jgi:hypothetical protein
MGSNVECKSRKQEKCSGSVKGTAEHDAPTCGSVLLESGTIHTAAVLSSCRCLTVVEEVVVVVVAVQKSCLAH